jgi:ankyrin repeat protein
MVAQTFKITTISFFFVIVLFSFCTKKGSDNAANIDTSKTTLVQPDTTNVNGTPVPVIPDIAGYSASELGKAVYANNIQLVKELVEKGATTTNCLATETYEFDLLFAAIEFAKIDILRYVLDNKFYSSINKVYTEESLTPLSLACMIENSQDAVTIAELLIKNGADVNGSGSSGGDYTYYPLISAINKINIPLVKLLIDNGAKTTVQDNQGKTPVSYAQESGNQEIIDLVK